MKFLSAVFAVSLAAAASGCKHASDGPQFEQTKADEAAAEGAKDKGRKPDGTPAAKPEEKKGGGLFGWLFGKKKEEPAVPVVAGVAPGRTPEEAAFTEACARMGAGGGTITGEDGWLFAAAELKRIGSLPPADAHTYRSSVAAIADYQQTLRRENIQLVVVPVPARTFIYADKLSDDLKVPVKSKRPVRLDSGLQDAMNKLRERGVRVVDLTDAMLDHRLDKGATACVMTANVWSPAGAQLAADVIAQEVKAAAGARALTKVEGITTEKLSVPFLGSLAASANPAPKTETLAVLNIGKAGADGTLKAVSFGRGGGDVCLLGDGNILAWRAANNPAGAPVLFTSLADHLANFLSTEVDVLADNSDGRNEPRLRILSSGTGGKNLLRGTRVVVWVFNSLDLASGGWRKVPLRLQFTEVQPDIELQ